MGFIPRFLNVASEEIKVKLNESRLLKFYQVKRLKENSAEKNFKEDLQFHELWNISTKWKEELKITQRTLFPGHTLR